MTSGTHLLFVEQPMFQSTEAKRMCPAPIAGPGLCHPLKGNFVPFVNWPWLGPMHQACSVLLPRLDDEEGMNIDYYMPSSFFLLIIFRLSCYISWLDQLVISWEVM